MTIIKKCFLRIFLLFVQVGVDLSKVLTNEKHSIVLANGEFSNSYMIFLTKMWDLLLFSHESNMYSAFLQLLCRNFVYMYVLQNKINPLSDKLG